jgi:hypothetical protein
LNQSTAVFVRAAADRIGHGLTPLEPRIVDALDDSNPGFRRQYDTLIAPFTNILKETN